MKQINYYKIFFRSETIEAVQKIVLLSTQMPCHRCIATAAKGITAPIRASLVSLLLALSVCLSYAQSCVSWQLQLGEPALDERATDISYHKNDQSIWVSGYQTSAHKTGAENSKNAWLLKINNKGEIIDELVIVDSTELIAKTLVHQNENLFVGGYHFQLNKPNEKKAWLAMHNTNTVEWMYKNEHLSEIKDMLQLNNGDLITTGYIQYSDTTKKLLTVERWTSDGTTVWSKTYGGSKDEEGNALSLYNENTLILTGFTASFDGDVSQPIGGRDAWLLQINTDDGSLIQEKNFGGTANDVAVDVAVLPNQQIAILTESLSTNGDISQSIGFGDFWLCLINQHWDIIWEKSYGGVEPDFPKTIEIFPNGDMLLAGTSFSNDGDITTQHENVDFISSWIAKVDQTNGTLLWSKVIGGNDQDEIVALQIFDDRQIIAAGNTDSNNIQCKTASEKHSNQNFWLLGLDELLLNTADLIIEKDNLVITYNIQKPYLNLRNNSNSSIDFLIADISGKFYYQAGLKNAKTQSINFSNWKTGMYMLIYKNDKQEVKIEKIGLF